MVITITFFFFLAVFTGIGIWATVRKKTTPEDYLVASRGVHPALVALSAVATQNSGFMFIGLTGMAYFGGVSASLWVMAGWVVGDAISWTFVHRRLREKSEESGATTIPGFLGEGLKGPWGRAVVILGALATLVFLGIYASAQLTAGRKALEVFEIDATLGVVLGAGMVAAYCFAGGIRASIWTDTAQSIAMFLSMAILLTVALIDIGGPIAMWDALEAEKAELVRWLPEDPKFGVVLFILGWVVAGFGVVGQPHIIIRAMTIDSPENVNKARTLYLSFFAVFSVLCMAVGLTARVLIPYAEGFDQELAFPLLADGILPDVLVGFMLAGLFAGTISTADSQVLSCSAAITQDLVPDLGRSYLAVKAATLAVTAAAMVFAIVALKHPEIGDSVFNLVTFAWSGLASGLGPLMIVRVLGGRIVGPVAFLMIAAGLAAVILWVQVLEFGDHIYAALPGMTAGAVVYLVATPFMRES